MAQRLRAILQLVVDPCDLVTHRWLDAITLQREHGQVKWQSAGVLSQLVVVARKGKGQIVRHASRPDGLDLFERPGQPRPISRLQRTPCHREEIRQGLVGIRRIDGQETYVVVARLVQSVEMRIAVRQPQQDVGVVAALP